ncbi:glycosyltransferase family 4 protein [Thermaurantiacus tibetensis]|uniref:glycosyltransferase family 4 protein n=1 Tax=Thermaurantiacus tibetensis TaxID=2759035 RepID=UPI001890633D|nr:glycosyltransferase family 1 protein [Thermaurantiacus tibetensis]
MSDRAGPAGRPLRVAVFSGNYNYVRDGANQALNRLVGRMLARGDTLPRVYAPVSKTPAFPPTGDLVPVPSVPIPGRSEYRLGLGLSGRVRADLEAFAPDLVHLSAPDLLGHRAKRWAFARGLPVVASVHTRFETYGDYYGLGWLRGWAEDMLRRFYGDLAEIYAPTEGMAELLRAGGFSQRVRIWSRGVDHALFHPGRRDLGWRRSLGIGDSDFTVGFVGRLVLEKGLDVVAAVDARLRALGVAHRLLVVGDGPARAFLERAAPGAIFTGFLTGEALARAHASADLFLNPSVTETFGNVTLEAMACGVPVVAADATGSRSLVVDGLTGRLVPAGDVEAFAAAIAAYAGDREMAAAHGAAGHARAQAFEWDRVNDAVIDRYALLVRRESFKSAPAFAT